MTRARRPSGDGYILVAVLGVMLLLTGFMAAGSLLVRSTLDAVRVGDADAAMSGLTRGGIELTAYQLFVVKAAPAAIDRRRIKFGGGSVAPSIGDEGGKADLNGSDPKLLAAVFQSAGLDAQTAAELVAFVVKMRGADRNPSDATAGPGAQPRPASQPAQTDDKKMLRGFQSVDQIGDFRDLTRSDLHALRPLLTVFNPDGKINVMSASRDMLQALPGVSGADIEVILARRDQGDKKEIEGLLEKLGESKSFVKTTFGPAFAVRIDATSATGRKKSVHAVLAASKSPNDPYYVLDWWE